MARSSAAKLLTSVDSLFTTQEERDQVNGDRVVNLPPSAEQYVLASGIIIVFTKEILNLIIGA